MLLKHDWKEVLPDTFICSICGSARILAKNLKENFEFVDGEKSLYYNTPTEVKDRTEHLLVGVRAIRENYKNNSDKYGQLSAGYTQTTYLYTNKGYYKLNENSIEGNWIFDHTDCKKRKPEFGFVFDAVATTAATVRF